MATTISSLESTVRDLIGDISKSGIDEFVYGSSAIFTLTEPNIITVDSVSVNDVSSGVDYSYDEDTNKVTISSSLSIGDIVEIQYTYYPDYSSTEVQSFIRAGLTHIATNRYKKFLVTSSSIYPTPTDQEKDLICMVASILIRPDNKSYRLPDITINIPKDKPTRQIIQEVVAIFKKNCSGIFTIL